MPSAATLAARETADLDVRRHRRRRPCARPAARCQSLLVSWVSPHEGRSGEKVLSSRASAHNGASFADAQLCRVSNLFTGLSHAGGGSQTKLSHAGGGSQTNQRGGRRVL